MSLPFNFNGNVHADGKAVLLPSNRAFRYGDGLFESIRVFEGDMPFFDRHWRRLLAGMEVLKFEIPAHFSPNFFQNEISKLTDGQGNWRVRLTVSRSGGGLYTPEQNGPEFLIETSPLPVGPFELNPHGLTIGVYPAPLLPCLTPPALSNFKTCNALLFVLAGIFKKEKGWDDCLLLNTAGRVACGGSSNVFLVKNGGLVTPPLSEGCVAGTMREVVLELADGLGIGCSESPVTLEDLAEAEGVFLTNAVQGIRWAGLVTGAARLTGPGISVTLVAALNAEMGRSRPAN